MSVRVLRKLTPGFVLSFYHFVWATLSALRYGSPSKRMVVIGVTGTKGKTTTSILMHHVLLQSGLKVGLLSTAEYKIGDKEIPTVKKMTMPGHGKLQKYLRDMLDAGCTHVVVESSSEGVRQSRHVGIHYDVMLLTNLTPEHVESHGSYEAYRNAKAKLFSYTSQFSRKQIQGKEVPRVRILPSFFEHREDEDVFLRSSFSETIYFGFEERADVRADGIEESSEAVSFDLSVLGESRRVRFAMPGKFNVLNVLAVATVAEVVGVSKEHIVSGVESFEGVPGRIEIITHEPFTVIVDFAYEPASYRAIFEAARAMSPSRIISVIGSCGGGRDVARRPVLGEIAVTMGDIAVVTNEDPYDDPPQDIIDQVADGAVRAGGVENETVFRVPKRRDGIRKALSLARPGDVVLLLAKGSEVVMAVADGKLAPWNDKKAALEELKKLN